MTGAAAVLESVSRSFRGDLAVDDVTATVPQDRITGLLGRNGAGKTTLMRLLAAHLRPDSGRVEVDGVDPWENQAVLSRTCFVREAQRYPDWLTVAQALRSASWLQPAWDAELGDELAADFRLPLRRRVAKLSRGQLSAVGVVIGLASRAPLTIFDEPYLGLDAVARQLFYDRLLADYAEHPRTVVLSTHLIDEVSNLLDHVLVLHDGRLLLDEPAEQARARGATFTGPAAAVDQLLAGRSALRREALGRTARVSVGWALEGSEHDRARRLDVTVEGLSLQELVVAAAADPATARLDPTEVLS